MAKDMGNCPFRLKYEVGDKAEKDLNNRVSVSDSSGSTSDWKDPSEQ